MSGQQEFRLSSGNRVVVDGAGVRVGTASGDPLAYFPSSDLKSVNRVASGVAMWRNDGNSVEFAADPRTSDELLNALLQFVRPTSTLENAANSFAQATQTAVNDARDFARERNWIPQDQPTGHGASPQPSAEQRPPTGVTYNDPNWVNVRPEDVAPTAPAWNPSPAASPAAAPSAAMPGLSDEVKRFHGSLVPGETLYATFKLQDGGFAGLTDRRLVCSQQVGGDEKRVVSVPFSQIASVAVNSETPGTWSPSKLEVTTSSGLDISLSYVESSDADATHAHLVQRMR